MWPTQAAASALVLALFPGMEAAQAVIVGEFGRWVWAAWFTAMGTATQIANPPPDEFDFPTLHTLGGEGLAEALVLMAAGLAIIGDWAGLDELAAAAVQTFLQSQPPSFGG